MTDWDKLVEEYNNPDPGDEVRCIHCDRRIRYNDDFEIWTHFNTGKPHCEPLTSATPPTNYRP